MLVLCSGVKVTNRYLYDERKIMFQISNNDSIERKIVLKFTEIKGFKKLLAGDSVLVVLKAGATTTLKYKAEKVRVPVIITEMYIAE